MIADEWQATRSSSVVVPRSQEIISQALTGPLVAPSGWRSELLHSSSSTSNDSGTNLINTDTSYFNSHEEYKVLNTTDTSPIIFSSSKEANQLIHEIPSTTILPSTNLSRSSSTEYVNAAMCQSSIQDRKTVIINDQQSEPVIVHKTLPNNTVTYQQNVSVRYLQPPTPPPSDPIIIREVRPPAPPAPSPLQVRQRPPPPPTPPPIVIRERPPLVPPRLPTQVIEKLLPPPPRPPRRVIVERLGACPPKPPDVFLERWLPYRRSEQRRILFERAPAPYMPPKEPNLLILHDQPHARVHSEFINQGVTRADPQTYLQRYGAEIDSWHIKSKYAHLINEADRTIPPPHPLSLPHVQDGYHGYHPNTYPSSPVASVWDRMRSASPLPHTFAPTGVYPDYHGANLNRYPSPVQSAWDRMRSVSPLPHAFAPTGIHHDYHGVNLNRYPSPVQSVWDRMRSVSPLPHALSYQHNYPQYNSSYHSPIPSPLHYNHYAGYGGDVRTMADVTSSWDRSCHSHLPSYDFSPAYPPRTMYGNFDSDLQHSLSGLTTGHPSYASFHSY